MARSYYLDNLKVMLTVLVIAHHAMIPFADGEGWAYHPSIAEETMPYMWHFLSTNAAFFMGLFFMISGYFVPKSFDRQGFATFVWKKALRLLVPMALITAVLSLATGTPEAGHTWFLSSLFAFCLVYALIRLVCKKCNGEQPLRLTLLLLVAFAAVMGVGGYFIRQFYPQDEWIHLWVYKFEPAHYLQYIMMFALGVLAGHGNWFDKMSDIVGRTALIIGTLLCVGNYLRAGGAWDGFVWHWFGIYESFLCVFFCVGLVWLFKEIANWDGRFWQWSASQAFGAYVIHLFVLLTVQNLLDKLWVSVVGKFLLVTALAVFFSFVITWLLRLIPGVKKVL